MKYCHLFFSNTRKYEEFIFWHDYNIWKKNLWKSRIFIIYFLKASIFRYRFLMPLTTDIIGRQIISGFSMKNGNFWGTESTFACCWSCVSTPRISIERLSPSSSAAQDAGLDALAAVISRQKMMGQEIGNELDEQNGKVDSVSAVCLNQARWITRGIGRAIVVGCSAQKWAARRNRRLAALYHTNAVLTQNHSG